MESDHGAYRDCHYGPPPTLVFQYKRMNHDVEKSHDAESFSSALMKKEANFPLSASNFNDLSVYQALCHQVGCVRVDLARVLIYHKENYIVGIQSVYQSTLRDPKGEQHVTIESTAPQHWFDKRVLSVSPDISPSVTISTVEIDVANHEHLINIHIRPALVYKPMTFVSNQRTTVSGGSFSTSQCRPLSESSSRAASQRRVVALSGIISGESCIDIGCYTVPNEWETLKPLLCLRGLCERRRAVSRYDSDDLHDGIQKLSIIGMTKQKAVPPKHARLWKFQSSLFKKFWNVHRQRIGMTSPRRQEDPALVQDAELLHCLTQFVFMEASPEIFRVILSYLKPSISS